MHVMPLSNDALHAGFRAADQRRALKLLEHAWITGEQVPADFDGPGSLEALAGERVRYDLQSAAERSPATTGQREDAGDIVRLAKALASAIRNADPKVKNAFWDSNPKGAVKLKPNVAPAREWTADELRDAWGKGRVPLSELGALCDRVVAAAPYVKASFGGLDKDSASTIQPCFPAQDRITAQVELIGSRLPALYEKFLGRPYKAYATEGAQGAGLRYSEGVRFVRAASAFIGIKVSESAALDARKLFVKVKGRARSS